MLPQNYEKHCRAILKNALSKYQGKHYIISTTWLCLIVWHGLINFLIALNDISEEAIDEYFIFSETLRAKSINIMNELKDFQPTE